MTLTVELVREMIAAAEDLSRRKGVPAHVLEAPPFMKAFGWTWRVSTTYGPHHNVIIRDVVAPGPQLEYV